MKLPPVVIYSLSINLIIALLASGLLLYFRFSYIRLVRFGISILGHLFFFGVLGLILAQFNSLIAPFIVLSCISLICGCLHIILDKKLFPWLAFEHPGYNFLAVFIGAVWSTFGFSVVYGVLSAAAPVFLPCLMGGITPFLIPFMVRLSFFFWMHIPALRYKRWYYDSNEALPILEPIMLMTVNVQFTKVPDESNPNFEGYSVQFPSDVALGFLYQYFIYSHNNRHQDYKKSPISYQINTKPLGWVLYKKGQNDQRIYLDTSKSLKQNSIMHNDTILAQSYSD